MKEHFIQHFIDNPEQIIGIILMFLVLVYLAITAHARKTELWEAIKGEDGKLQLPEAVMSVWLLLFPIVVLSSLFLGKHPDPSVTYSLDMILFLILGFKSARSIVQLQQSKNKNNPPQDKLEQ